MKIGKHLILEVMGIIILIACGGSGGGAPVEMSKFESDVLVVEYPEAWEDTSADMLGVALAVFSPTEFSIESLLTLEDPFSLLGSDPFVAVIVMPAELAREFGVEGLDEAIIPEEEGITIVRQGDVDISGAKGREVIAKGSADELGGKKFGMHFFAAEKDDGSVLIFSAMTPEKDLDKNLEVFAYMVKSVELR